MNGFEVEGETWREREREDTMERANAHWGRKAQRNGHARGRAKEAKRYFRTHFTSEVEESDPGRLQAHWIGMQDQTSLSEVLKHGPCNSEGIWICCR